MANTSISGEAVGVGGSLPVSIAGEPLGKLLRRCRRRADQHRQTAARWTRYAALHAGPDGHTESRDKCLARVKRELRLSEIWGAYADAAEQSATHVAQVA